MGKQTKLNTVHQLIWIGINFEHHSAFPVTTQQHHQIWKSGSILYVDFTFNKSRRRRWRTMEVVGPGNEIWHLDMRKWVSLLKHPFCTLLEHSLKEIENGSIIGDWEIGPQCYRPMFSFKNRYSNTKHKLDNRNINQIIKWPSISKST